MEEYKGRVMELDHIPGAFPNTSKDSSQGHVQQGQNFTFDSNESGVQPFTSNPQLTQQIFSQTGILSNQQISCDHLFDEEVSNDLDSGYQTGFLGSDFSDIECIDTTALIESDVCDTKSTDTENTAASTFTPGFIEVSDYCISEVEVKDGILIIHSTDSKTSNANASISDDANYFSNQVGSMVKKDDLLHSYPIGVRLPMNKSELAFAVNHRCTSDAMQFGIPTPVPGTTSGTGPEVLNAFTIHNQGEVQQLTQMIGEKGSIGVQQNTASQLAGGLAIFRQEGLVLEDLQDTNYFRQQDGWNVDMQEALPHSTPVSLPGTENVSQNDCSSNIAIQFGLPPPVLGSTLRNSEVSGRFSMYEQGEEQELTSMNRERVWMEVEENTIGQGAGGLIIFPQGGLPLEDLNDTNHLSQQDHCEVVREDLRHSISISHGVNASDLKVALNEKSTDNVMQFGLPAVASGNTSSPGSEVPHTSSTYSQRLAQPLSPMIGERVWTGVESSIAGQLAGRYTILLLEKELRYTDVEVDATGILLPKKPVEAHFGPLSVSDKVGREIILYDAEDNSKRWMMRLTAISTRSGPVYRLKESVNYINHYGLKEGDLLQIFLELPENRPALKFEKKLPIYKRTALDNSLTHAPAWTRIIIKKLTKSDIEVGFVSSGTIFLKKKDAEKHFPRMQEKEGFLDTFFDWEGERTWLLRLKVKSKSQVYMLHNISSFLTFYELREGDIVDIFKSQTQPARYALRARKIPLI